MILKVALLVTPLADIDDVAAEIVLVVHWVGGVHSEIRLPKRRRLKTGNGNR
jgi:hypothetical protein